MATGRPAAAASVLAPLLTGKHRSVTLVAHTATARYFATGAPDAPLLCLCLPEAVRLPCALIADDLPAAGQHPAGSPEQTGRVGGGRLEVAGYTARVARWWRPYRPRGPVRLAGTVPCPLDGGGEDAATELRRALACGAPLDPPVRALLGRGPGLTPLGDDVLAGLLVTLVALGAPGAGRLAATVRQLAPGRTATVSAALLHHAARGECVPQLAAALTGDRAGLDALLRVGHTSGAGLAWGAAVALAAPLLCLPRRNTKRMGQPLNLSALRLCKQSKGTGTPSPHPGPPHPGRAPAAALPTPVGRRPRSGP